MDNGVAPGLHISACPFLCLYVLNSLTLMRWILKKRTPGLCSNTWSGFHFESLLSTIHRKLVGNPSLCRFVLSFFSLNIQQDICAGVLSGWEKAESRRKRRLRWRGMRSRLKLFFDVPEEDGGSGRLRSEENFYFLLLTYLLHGAESFFRS